MSDNFIERISTALGSEKTLEGFVRQLLEMLELVTGMESTYLTRIDDDRVEQHILFARNSQQMQIPEGLSVPWQDTLCKRALDEGRTYTCNVPEVWGDSQAAGALGITTYVSTPVTLADGAIFGTLCAASSQSKPLTQRANQVLMLFSELIAQHIRREQLLQELSEANDALTAVSYTDELTRLPNRRAVFHRLPGLFARCSLETRSVLMAFVDLDGFKQINDRYGHETGDAFLQAIALRLQSFAAVDSVLGRLGGDEFIVACPGPLQQSDAAESLQALREQLTSLLAGRYPLAECTIDYAGASLGILAVDPHLTPDQAVRAADAAMYQDKARRKQAAREADRHACL
ncbi:diguanylate cyclase [Erwinia sp. E602]|uniref:sensor domain-containing diguanylate cyclase n=1 Tax=Erwinia sp. E602 TaxID=2675378 RepID=UPI001BADABF2|nr:sensor domain-containing diguanylate cyclase [Erwinia sp. E602]QUG76755.1 diguanylate cyclase [Erwinia sp. E602]